MAVSPGKSLLTHFDFVCYEVTDNAKVLESHYSRHEMFNAFSQESRGIWTEQRRGNVPHEKGIIHRVQIPYKWSELASERSVEEQILEDLARVQGSPIKLSKHGFIPTMLKFDHFQIEEIKSRCVIQYPPGTLTDRFYDKYAKLIHDFRKYCFGKGDAVYADRIFDLIMEYEGLQDCEYKWANKQERWVEVLRSLYRGVSRDD